MNADSNRHGRRFLIDSAVFIALGAALLYLLGDVHRTVRFGLIGVPWDFVRPLSLDETADVGAAHLLILVPLVALLDIVTLPLHRQIAEKFRGLLRRIGPIRTILLAVYAVYVSVLVVVAPTVRDVWRNDQFVVTAISLKPGAGISMPQERLRYVTATDHELVFVPLGSAKPRRIIIIARDAIARLEIESAGIK